jgi:hypothetical protein
MLLNPTRQTRLTHKRDMTRQVKRQNKRHNKRTRREKPQHPANGIILPKTSNSRSKFFCLLFLFFFETKKKDQKQQEKQDKKNNRGARRERKGDGRRRRRGCSGDGNDQGRDNKATPPYLLAGLSEGWSRLY